MKPPSLNYKLANRGARKLKLDPGLRRDDVRWDLAL